MMLANRLFNARINKDNKKTFWKLVVIVVVLIIIVAFVVFFALRSFWAKVFLSDEEYLVYDATKQLEWYFDCSIKIREGFGFEHITNQKTQMGTSNHYDCLIELDGKLANMRLNKVDNEYYHYGYYITFDSDIDYSQLTSRIKKQGDLAGWHDGSFEYSGYNNHIIFDDSRDIQSYYYQRYELYSQTPEIDITNISTFKISLFL